MTPFATPRRLRRHGQPESSSDAGPHPLPPYQVSGVEMVYLSGTLSDPGLTRLLPKGITQSPGKSCMIALYTAARGWGIAPFSATYARIALSGLDSPDSSEALFHLAGQASGLAGQILQRDYSQGYAVGETQVHCAGRKVTAAGSFGPGTALHFQAEFADDTVINSAGAHRQMGMVPGGLVEWTGAYDTKYRLLRVTEVEIRLPPEHPFAFLNRFKLAQADWLFEKSFTLSRALPVEGQLTATPALFQIIDTLHPCTVLVNSDGQVGRASPAARALFQSDQDMRSAVAEVWHWTEREPHKIRTSQGLAMVRVLPVAADLWGQQARLAVLSMPSEKTCFDAAAQLRLMGLTPGEARIAAALSEGVTAPMAAGHLGLTSNTIRSTLKSIYLKLGIRHRSELSAIVARLAR